MDAFVVSYNRSIVFVAIKGYCERKGIGGREHDRGYCSIQKST